MIVTFSRKAIPIPAEYRPLYKIAQILQVLELSSRGKKASLLKLHLFSWAFKSKENMDKLIALRNNPDTLNIKIWGLEPSLNRALVFAVAEGLCIHENSNYKITKRGSEFIEQISKDEDLLKDQRLFLENLGKSITESLVLNISKSWKN